jgi:trk system potassium uptake protein TrkH
VSRTVVVRASRRLHPARAVVSGFLGAITIGTLLLVLPVAAEGRGATPLEALFTAVSAVCVTGLTVVDTPVFWSPFGEAVILLLIQVGGLGIMLFASLIGVLLARKLSIRGRASAASETKSLGVADVRGLVTGIATITFVIEGAVAIVLFFVFWLRYGFSPADAVWNAVFHAVSAFNNAGFALFSDNLMGFATDPLVCLPLAVAIILGGLGFPVIMQLRKELRSPLHWSMNTNIVVWATAVLLVAGTVYICFVEWNNPATLGSMDVGSRILSGFFHSVQARTAGFNAVDIGQMHNETWLGLDILMFIGGGPAGTAGGIKVTTFAVLFFIIYTELRGETAVNIFGKRLSRAVHRQAITTALLAVAVIIVATVVIMHITDLSLDRVLFEAISAFATVGLSTGITATLPPAAQVILIVLMFLGRLGPLTLGTAIALKQRPLLYELPKERPVIG